jgi:twitching motility protein PilU
VVSSWWPVPLAQANHDAGGDARHRNTNQSGHILTIEDPIEYLFRHKKSLVNQRELSVDTLSYHSALVNALREAPDLIMIGEVRDRDTMQQALIHTLTGHLCLTTIHANNSYHAMSRIINMFPHDARSGVLSDLSIGLRAIICQRLVRNQEGNQQPATEILLNTPMIADLIKNGEIGQIKEAMEQSLYPGTQTFEQALCRLHLDRQISYDEAMKASDSPTNLAWLINQSSPTSRVEAMPQADGKSAPRKPAAILDRCKSSRRCSTERSEKTQHRRGEDRGVGPDDRAAQKILARSPHEHGQRAIRDARACPATDRPAIADAG